MWPPLARPCRSAANCWAMDTTAHPWTCVLTGPLVDLCTYWPTRGPVYLRAYPWTCVLRAYPWPCVLMGLPVDLWADPPPAAGCGWPLCRHRSLGCHSLTAGILPSRMSEKEKCPSRISEKEEFASRMLEKEEFPSRMSEKEEFPSRMSEKEFPSRMLEKEEFASWNRVRFLLRENTKNS